MSRPNAISLRRANSGSDRGQTGLITDITDLARMTHFGHRGSLWPTDQSGWNPAGLTTLRPTCRILGTEILWLGVTAEQDAVIERVDIDRAQGAAGSEQNHCHVHAAPTADYRLGSM